LSQIKSAARSLSTRAITTAPPCVGPPCVAPPSSSPAPVPHRHGQLNPKACLRSPQSTRTTAPPSLYLAASILPMPALPHPASHWRRAQSRQLSSTSHGCPSSPTSHGSRRRLQLHGFTLCVSFLPHPGLRRCRVQCGQLSQAPRCSSSHLQARTSSRGSRSFWI
jgi:hypothetical protein